MVQQIEAPDPAVFVQAAMRKKIVLIGPDGGVGKTTYSKRLLTGEFEEKFVKTLGVDVPTLPDHGVTLWDCGSGPFIGLGPGYLIGANGVIVMLDASDGRTFQALPGLLDMVMESCAPGIPIVVCANKIDVRATNAQKGRPQGRHEVDLEVARETVRAHSEKARLRHPVHFCPLSVKSCYNLREPLRILGAENAGPPHDPDGPLAPVRL